MLRLLEQGLHSRNGFVRKGCALALQGPKQLALRQATAEDYQLRPPVLANSFPKSGTHLLDQIVAALPARRNFGDFVSSMTSSFQFRTRSPEETAACLRKAAPGEIVRGHLFFHDGVAAALPPQNFVHYFIYRDPRDVVLSESHYLRSLNRWHKLHPYFREAASLEDAVALSIRGLPELAPTIDYPDIAARFERYAGWIGRPDVFAVRFEELTSPRQAEMLAAMAEFYAARTTEACRPAELAAAMEASIDPQRSHTYRQGRSGGWREKFTPGLRQLFEELAGDLLQRYQFEPF